MDQILTLLPDVEEDLLVRCLNKDADAEKELYRRIATQMYGICLRYAGNTMEAKDIMQNGFIRLFMHLQQFRHEGKFNAWARRIFVNAAISYYWQQLKFRDEVGLSFVNGDPPVDETILTSLSVKDLLDLVRRLPVGSRTVFNLFVIDGFQHKEIATLLGISEGTSKSQLSRAKAMIRRMLAGMEI